MRVRLLAGTAYGKASPVRVFSPLFYLEAELPMSTELPLPEEHEERGVYVLSGELGTGEDRLAPRSLYIFKPGGAPQLRANRDSRVLLLGGTAPDGPRYIEWNFVSSSRERIEQAKAEWQTGAFPKVPGDELEFIPLPEPKPRS